MEINLDKIVSIKEIGTKKTIDISVSGDNLFFANDILTHNCGQTSTDMDVTDVGESIGIAHTLDLFIGLMSTEELEEMGQIMVKQLKNRYNDISYYKRFTIGIDRSKMRLFDVESSAQNNISGAGKTDNSNEFDSGFKTKNKTIEVGGFKF